MNNCIKNAKIFFFFSIVIIFVVLLLPFMFFIEDFHSIQFVDHVLRHVLFDINDISFRVISKRDVILNPFFVFFSRSSCGGSICLLLLLLIFFAVTFVVKSSVFFTTFFGIIHFIIVFVPFAEQAIG